MFCGAGGSSQGARDAGIEVKLAMNHWKLAIETHSANFPETDHDCADISASDPRRYESTDILIASPECTNHSLAKGKGKTRKQLNMFETQKQAEDRSRATMWDVPRWAEYHDYNIIITENVVDAKRWIMYDAWIKAMQLLGYDYRECFLNSMHFHPTPQSRDRLFVVFWKKGNKAPDLNYMPEAFCPKCEKKIFAIQSWKEGCKNWGKYRTQYVYKCSCGTTVEPYYYAAFNCIDFSIKSERIGDKKRQLKPNTLKRVAMGIEKYWNNPFVMYGGDARQVDRCYSLDKALPTQCSQPWHSLVVPFITYTNNNHGFEPPFIAQLYSSKSSLRSIQDAIGTQQTSKHDMIITSEAWNSFIGYYYGNAYESHITDALGTCTSKDRHYKIDMPAMKKIAVEDCYYRMIRSKEVGKAMAFGDSYIVLGDEREKVRQYGNAVTPPVMKWLIQQCVNSLK